MMNKIKLMPYTIHTIEDNLQEIPSGVEMIEAPLFWNESKMGEGNVIAVIDTGIQIDHPDLQNRIIGGRNFTTDYNSDPLQFNDNNGHGTHVAGTIAASMNNQGVVGVAPKADLLALKVLTENGSGAYEWIINAIHYAIDWRGSNGERVRVISMSLGGPEDNPQLREAIKRAVDNQIPVVVAAGNEGDNDLDTIEQAYPGNYNEVIQVGAIDFNKNIAPFTNTNDEIDLVAPGVNILSTYLKGTYARLSGTSMAAPHIAGSLALIINVAEKQFNRTLTESEIYAQLIKRTIPLEYPYSAVGNGMLAFGISQKIQELIKSIEKV
jgi:major intracellular serine protease